MTAPEARRIRATTCRGHLETIFIIKTETETERRVQGEVRLMELFTSQVQFLTKGFLDTVCGLCVSAEGETPDLLDHVCAKNESVV